MNLSWHLPAFLLEIVMFEVGQFVYTKHEIRGWFDYSTNHFIPKNYKGKILSVLYESAKINDTIYNIEFDKEYGCRNIRHADLKLG